MLSAGTLVKSLDGRDNVFRCQNWRTLVKKGFTCITTSVDHCHIGICHVLALVLSIGCVSDGITDSAPAPPIPILKVKGDQAIHLGRHVSNVVGWENV